VFGHIAAGILRELGNRFGIGAGGVGNPLADVEA
jgi:hypothetical protein